MVDKRTLIGAGYFGWMTEERIYGRYGTVCLEPNINRAIVNALCGQKGSILAKVVQNGAHRHIGDTFFNIFPETPEIGEEVVVGNGNFFIVDKAQVTSVGLWPDNDKNIPWLDVKSLYRVVDQYVELYFVEGSNGKEINPSDCEDRSPS